MAVYTIFSQTGGGSATSDFIQYTMGMQFTVSQTVALTGIWFYSVSVAGAVLPHGCCIFQQTGAGTGTVVTGTSNTSPSWSGAAGSGWVKCTYDGSISLTSGVTYKVSVLTGADNGEGYSFTSGYWTTGGPGAGGLSNGPLSAPDNTGGDGGQDTFTSTSGTLVYPAASSGSSNYWVDVEVSTGGGAPVVAAPQCAVMRTETIPGRGRSMIVRR